MFFNAEKKFEKFKLDFLINQEKARQEKEDEKKKIEVFQLEEKLNKLIICVSNEIENIKVAVGKEIIFITKAKNPILVATNILTGEEFLCMGKTFMYTEQKFKALNATDPNALIAIFYSPDSEHTVDKSYCQTDVVEDKKTYEEKVLSKVQEWIDIKNAQKKSKIS
jgi:hypothetical protein